MYNIKWFGIIDIDVEIKYTNIIFYVEYNKPHAKYSTYIMGEG